MGKCLKQHFDSINMYYLLFTKNNSVFTDFKHFELESFPDKPIMPGTMPTSQGLL